MKNLIKTVIAVLLLLCLLDMPYGYFQFVRVAATLGFAFMAYEAKQAERIPALFIYLGLAVLFQPLFKIALDRTLWNSVDLLVAAGLLISVFFNSRKT